jgi:hypothetical protein
MSTWLLPWGGKLHRGRGVRSSTVATRLRPNDPRLDAAEFRGDWCWQENTNGEEIFRSGACKLEAGSLSIDRMPLDTNHLSCVFDSGTASEQTLNMRLLCNDFDEKQPSVYGARAQATVRQEDRAHHRADGSTVIEARHPRPSGRVAVILSNCQSCCARRDCLPNASASGISCTPAVGSALLAHAGSGLADTVDHYPTCATAHTGFRDRTVGLMQLHERRCLCSASEN